MLINSFMWSPPKFACTAAIRTTIYTCLALALTVWVFICLLPLPLHKAPSAPSCFSTQEFNTEDSCSACPYQQGSNTTGTQHTNSTPNSITTPQSFTVILLLLCFSFFYNVPPTQGGFPAPFSTFLPLSCGKTKELPRIQVCCRKISLLIYYMNIFLSPTLHRLLRTVFYSGDTS